MAVAPGGALYLQDPQYLAFARAAGFDDTHNRMETQARQAEIEAAKGIRRNNFAQALERQNTATRGQFGNQGFAGSAMQAQEVAQNTADVGGQQALSEQGDLSQEAGLSRDLTYNLGKSQVDLGKEQYPAADRVARSYADAANAKAGA